jgi:hypothetical protein
MAGNDASPGLQPPGSEGVSRMPAAATVEKRTFPSRWRKGIAITGLSALLLGLLGGSFCFLALWQDIQLRQAIAETDQLDPGWRIRELEAKRAVLPDEQNAAVFLMTADKALSVECPCWEDQPSAPQNKGRDPEEIMALRDSFWNLQAPVQLTEDQLQILRHELMRVAPALVEARKVADLPQGRYPASGLQAGIMKTDAAGFVSMLGLDHGVETGSIARWFAYDVLLRAQDQDLDGALASCRAILNTARAIGDEPVAHSTNTRLLNHFYALRGIERTLAQGQPSEAALAAVQRLLEEEATQPLFLIAARGARAIQDAAMEALQHGDFTTLQMWGMLDMGMTPAGSVPEEIMYALTRSAKSERAALLRFNNGIVEIAKRPAEEQRQALQQLARAQNQLPKLVRSAPTLAFGVATNHHHDLALMRSAIVMVAVERYRRAHGQWPTTPNDLVPIYLAKVPTDPYDGAPIRLARFPEGIVVYSVGEDAQDNGGNIAIMWKPGIDRGWRLWDVQHRRQPPPRNISPK